MAQFYLPMMVCVRTAAHGVTLQEASAAMRVHTCWQREAS